VIEEIPRLQGLKAILSMQRRAKKCIDAGGDHFE